MINNKSDSKNFNNSTIQKMPEKQFRNSAILQTRNKIKNDNLFRTSIKEPININNQKDNLPKKKANLLFGSKIVSDKKIHKHVKIKNRTISILIIIVIMFIINRIHNYIIYINRAFT